MGNITDSKDISGISMNHPGNDLTADDLINTINDSAIAIDMDGVIKDINGATLDLLGYARDDLIGQPLKVVLSKDSDLSRKGIDYLLEKKNIFNSKEFYESADSQNIAVSFSSSIILDENNEISGLLCVAMDVSGYRKIENALMASEEYFRAFVESSQDCICNISVDGTFMSMNSAGCRINGLQGDDEIVGKDCTANVVEKLDAMKKAFQEAVKGNHQALQYKSVNKKGEEIWWDSQLTPVKDFDGTVRSILRVSRNITEQKNIDTKLIDAQNMLIKEHNELSKLFKHVENAKREWESTMDCLGDIVIMLDKEGRIKRFNNALIKFTNSTYNEVLGKDLYDMMHEHQLEIVTFYAEGIEIFHKTTGRWFVVHSYPYEGASPENSGTVVTIHETTEVKTINEKLEKAYQDLKATQGKILQQEKMASIGQLAAGVAHEINNPMGFISSNIRTMEKYLTKIADFIKAQDTALEALEPGETTQNLAALKKKLKLDYILEDVSDLIAESLDGADRVKAIVQNLKTFSRVDEAAHKLVDLNECIESTLNIVWNEIKYKATVNKEYGELPQIKCYPQQLNQVFMNLLVNGAQAIDKSGEITIRTWHSEGSIYASVTDTGGGIPDDKIDKIFEPFFTTKDVGKGTGLGLSICYEIIETHKGEITVESEEGQGTTFTIRIPIQGAE